MAINKTNYADKYQVNFKQIKVESEQADNKISTADTLRGLLLDGKLAINTPWDTSNAYAGCNSATAGTGSYSVLSFDTQTSGEGGQQGEKPDLSKWQIGSNKVGGTINLRMFFMWGTQTNLFYRRPFHQWTNIPSELQNAYVGKEENNQVKFKAFNALTRKEASYNLYGNGQANIFTLSPITSIEINKLIYTVEFKINTVEFTNYNEETGTWKTAKNTSSESLSWSKVKPEDKLPAGERYDEELFTKGYKVLENTSEKLTIQYCSGCSISGYYGDSDAKFNKEKNSYENNSFGGRIVIGVHVEQELTTPTNVLGKYEFHYGQVVVMSELNIPELGTVYSGLPGVVFGSHSSVFGNVFGSDNFLNYSSNKQSIGSTYFNPLTTNAGNNSYGGIINTIKTEDNDIKVIIPDTILNASGVGDNYTSLRGSNYLYQDNGIYSNVGGTSGRSYAPASNAVFPISQLWATIASMGVYVALDDKHAGVAALGKLVGDNDNIYCGEMLTDGTTTGNMIQGGDIANLPQADMGDVMEDTPYTPPAPPSGDDPSNPPTPSGKGEDKLTGDSTKGDRSRNFPTYSITYYVLNDIEMQNFKELLWAQPKSFYNQIQIAGRQTGSIFDYISSVRYYPIKLLQGVTSQVFLGTGATLKNIDNNDVYFTKLGQLFDDYKEAFVWDLSDSRFNWRHNFLDYAPYCKISLYLPYAGTFDIDPQTIAAFNDITQTTISTDIVVDYANGSLTYYVYADDSYLLLNKTCKIAIDLPLNGNDSATQSASMLRNSINLGSDIIGHGVSLAKDISGLIAKNLKSIPKFGADLLSAGTDISNDLLDRALASRQIPVQVGGFGGTGSSIYEGQAPYLTVHRQKIANPENYGHAIGYLTESRQTIGNLTGYTVCRNPDLKNIPALAEEKSQIASLLTSGFFA